VTFAEFFRVNRQSNDQFWKSITEFVIAFCRRSRQSCSHTHRCFSRRGIDKCLEAPKCDQDRSIAVTGAYAVGDDVDKLDLAVAAQRQDRRVADANRETGAQNR
jgi:hypothetical protein